MRAKFTFDEMIYNTVIAGRQIYYSDGVIEEKKTIKYIKLLKDTRQAQVHCEDGDVFLANQDDIFTFEVNNIKLCKTPTKPKLMASKGLDIL